MILSCNNLDKLCIFPLVKISLPSLNSVTSLQALALNSHCFNKTTCSLPTQASQLGILITFVNTFCFNHLRKQFQCLCTLDLNLQYKLDLYKTTCSVIYEKHVLLESSQIITEYTNVQNVIITKFD
jgi:hypothetical protein